MSADLPSATQHPSPGALSDGLTSVAPQWAVAPCIKAFTTTRLGGVSKPPFDAMNLGLHVGDDVQAVTENRRRLNDAFSLPASPHWLNQTHSATVCSVPNADTGSAIADAMTEARVSAAPPALQSGIDGSWTDQPLCVLAVLTADCLPVVISDTAGTVVSVVHAGWRGLAAGILENALARFDPSLQLHAWLGPAIGPQAFEVGEDVLSAFEQRRPASVSAFEKAESRGKFWADIYELARGELTQNRDITITGGDYCTFTQSRLFHSHRRDGVDSGRMATVAWIASSV